MMYNEFCELLGSGLKVSMDDYKKIEFVYTWSKLIPDYGGKQKIVELFKVGGMELIENLIPAARLNKEIEYNQQKFNKLSADVEKYQIIGTALDELCEDSSKYWNKSRQLLDEMCDMMDLIDNLNEKFEVD